MCKGFGRIITIDYDRVIPDRTRTLAQGVVRPWQSGTGAESQTDLMKFCKANEIPSTCRSRSCRRNCRTG
jgi:excinuclease ABC subunit A